MVPFNAFGVAVQKRWLQTLGIRVRTHEKLHRSILSRARRKFLWPGHFPPESFADGVLRTTDIEDVDAPMPSLALGSVAAGPASASAHDRVAAARQAAPPTPATTRSTAGAQPQRYAPTPRNSGPQPTPGSAETLAAAQQSILASTTPRVDEAGARKRQRAQDAAEQRLLQQSRISEEESEEAARVAALQVAVGDLAQLEEAPDDVATQLRRIRYEDLRTDKYLRKYCMVSLALWHCACMLPDPFASLCGCPLNRTHISLSCHLRAGHHRSPKRGCRDQVL